MVGSSPASGFHFPDRDLCERPVKRSRITGTSSADRRPHELSDELATPERWKRLILPGSGQPRDDVGAPPNLFLRLGVG